MKSINANSELEEILVSSYKPAMVSYLKNHSELFNEAVALAVSDKLPFSWRAAWLLYHCIDENDKRLKSHIVKIIKSISGKKDGHQRELIKILLKMRLNEKQEGMLFNVCLDIWEVIYKSPSTRIIAIKYLFQISEKYPELKNEINFITQERYLETLSPGIKKSLRKLTKVSSETKCCKKKNYLPKEK